MSTRTLPTRCPLCAGRLHVEKVRCESCACAIEGQFGLGWVGALSPEQLAFVKVFLVCRGKIKDVEQVLGISYPTVVSRLDDLVASLGGALSQLEPTQPAERSLDVLEELASGAIDVNEAERRLKKKK
ncbi:MAG: DUF2089 domain-containing protein [Archangium sp.]|nr:DUF2089 domain-containing protein [Archangium sp.]